MNPRENITSTNTRRNPQQASTWQSVVNYVKSWVFCSKIMFNLAKSNDDDQSTSFGFLNGIPGKIDNYNIFVNNIRSKVGILILFQNSNLPFLVQFFEKLRKTDYLMDVLVHNLLKKERKLCFIRFRHQFNRRQKSNNY